MRASFIISFYKKIDILQMILEALERQSVTDFEVIIADDGSPDDVVKKMQEAMTRSKLSIQHIWHEDLGFRKTIILNRAILASRTDYLIFIDGDCIPHARFVEAHLAEREKRVALAGRRVNLSPKLTLQVTAEKIRAGYLDGSFQTNVWWDGLFGKTTHVEKAFYLNSNWIGKSVPSGDVHLLGCNWSIHKKDIMEINGFDERYQAPGWGEDTDIEERLRWNGVRLKTVKNRAIMYHLYHDLLDRPSENESIYRSVMKEKEAITRYGIEKIVK